MKTLLLTYKEVKQLLPMQEVMESVELAFSEKGLNRVQMPAKVYLFFKKYNGDLRTMPSYMEELDVSAVKVVNVHPDNRTKYGLPTVMAMIIMIDPKNGAPLVVMDGTWITAIRTGAAGGVAAKYLARKDSKTVGLVGAGTQSRTQLMALCTLFEKLEEVRVWSPKEVREKFMQEMRPLCTNVDQIVPVDTVESAVRGADIVVTATPSRTPLVSNDWISPGTHINCIGADAPGKEELDPAILKRSKTVVDDWEQASHSGEINVPLSQGIISQKDVFCELGEIVAGSKSGRESAHEITVFVATGLAIEDAVAAKIAFKKALAQQIGQYIEFV